MTKEELIEKIMNFNAVDSEQTSDSLFLTLKSYCEEYKKDTGDDSLDPLFENFYSPEQQTALIKEMIGEPPTTDSKKLAAVQTLLRPRRYDSEWAILYRNYFTDVYYYDLADLRRSILQALLPNERKQHYIRLLESIDDTDPDDIMDRIRQIATWYKEDYCIPMAYDILKNYLNYKEAQQHIKNLLETQGIYRVAKSLGTLLEPDCYTSEHFYIDERSWCLRFIHAEDAEALKQKLITALQEEIDND